MEGLDREDQEGEAVELGAATVPVAAMIGE